jgi:hypothetical protein
MKENLGAQVEGIKVRLVPYTEEFVPTYNQWMKDPFLQGNITISLSRVNI